MTAKKSTPTKRSEKLPTTFYRKVIHTTTGRLLNLTPVIPKNWKFVEILRWQTEGECIILTIMPIARGTNNASTTTPMQPNKQNTQASR